MKELGIPKKYLVRKGWEYEIIYKKGRRLRGDGFTMIFLRNNLGYNRLGISINKKIKGAVKRNRIKRIIRESFRLSRQYYPLNSDIVITVRPDFCLRTPAEISRAINLMS